jgi:hypothetical protein
MVRPADPCWAGLVGAWAGRPAVSGAVGVVQDESTFQDGSLATVCCGSGVQVSGAACGHGSTAGGGHDEPSGRDRTVS